MAHFCGSHVSPKEFSERNNPNPRDTTAMVHVRSAIETIPNEFALHYTQPAYFARIR